MPDLNFQLELLPSVDPAVPKSKSNHLFGNRGIVTIGNVKLADHHCQYPDQMIGVIRLVSVHFTLLTISPTPAETPVSCFPGPLTYPDGQQFTVSLPESAMLNRVR